MATVSTGAADYLIRPESTEDNQIDAGAGDDVVITGSGNDYVRGGEGNDYISTGAGDDTLAGGAGFNVLSGGSGRDTFLFDADDLGEPGAYAVNTITDFDPAEDRLRLTGFDFRSFAEIPAFVSATGVMLQIAPDRIVLLQNVFSLEALAERVELGGNRPELTVTLETDSGLPDGTVPEIVLEGRVTGADATGLLLSIDGGPEIDVTAALNPDGTFRIAADLFGPLEDGAHSFEIRALDAAGQSSEAVSLAVVLETAAIWTDPEGGDWGDASKWRDGVLPGEGDAVIMTLDEDAGVIFQTPLAVVESIDLTGRLDLQGGTLQAGRIEGEKGALLMSGGILKNTKIIGGEDFSIHVTDGTWRNVDLLADGHIGDGSRDVRLFAWDNLTIDAELELTGGDGQSAYLYLREGQSIDGSGLLRLTHQRSIVQLRSADSTARDTAVFGADLSIEGEGRITTRSDADRLQILGDVTALGGRLRLDHIDNAGARLSLDSAGGGRVELSSVENTIIDVAEGADVRLRDGSTHSGITLDGAGETRIEQASVNDLRVSGQAVIEAYLAVNGGLEVDGVLSLAGNSQGWSFLHFAGEQHVEGKGEIRPGRVNAASGESLSRYNEISLQGQVEGAREVLTFGEELTLRGGGTVTTLDEEDRIRILGEAAGIAGGTLILNRVDNGGAALRVDAREGRVIFGTVLENAGVTGTGQAVLGDDIDITNVTFNMDARFGSNTGSETVSLHGGLNVNASLEVAAGSGRAAFINAFGAQEIGGSGSIDLTRANAPTGKADNRIILISQSADEEVLVLGADLTIRGTGRIGTNSAEDRVQIHGTVAGRDGALSVANMDNQGAALKVDATEGDVILAERIENTVFDEVTGQNGRLTIGSSAVLDHVTLNIATEFAPLYSGGFTVTNGLVLNSKFTLAADDGYPVTMALSGSQAIEGSDWIHMSDARDPRARFQENYIRLRDESEGAETVTIGADIGIIGEGHIRSESEEDEFRVEGAIIADNGLLRADDIAPLEGMMGATDDGSLWLSEGVELTEDSILFVGLSGSGADARSGFIRSWPALEQKGTLALDIADDFSAETGDEFVILTANDGLSGSFDRYQGFDLAGDRAFELIERGGNTLVIRVTDDATAAPFNLADEFIPDLL